MTNLDIYQGALTLTGDRPASSEADYSERAKVLIPIALQALAPLDRILKRSRGKVPIPISGACVDMDDLSPLEDDLFACACYYLASELTAFEDSGLSSELFVRGEALRRIISDSIPFELKRI